MSAPLVSVILPFRDGGPYLAPAIESVLAQTFDDFELIAIDDGSRDGSGDVAARCARRDARVRLVSQEGRGLIATLNRGLQLARGSIVARMDADDLCLPTRLERQLAFLDQRPEVAVLGTWYQVFTDEGLTDRVYRLPRRHEEIHARLLTENTFMHPTTLMRREALESVGGYRSAFRDAEDYDLWLRLSERFELANLPEVLYHYRWHGAQAMFARIEQQCLSSLAAVECARRRRSGRPDPADQLEAPVDLEFLEAVLGLQREAVCSRIAETMLDGVRLLVEERLFAQAERLASALDARHRAGELGGRQAFVAARIAGWHAQRGRGRWLRAFAELGRCARAAPGPLAARLARSLHRRLQPQTAAGPACAS